MSSGLEVRGVVGGCVCEVCVRGVSFRVGTLEDRTRRTEARNTHGPGAFTLTVVLLLPDVPSVIPLLLLPLLLLRRGRDVLLLLVPLLRSVLLLPVCWLPLLPSIISLLLLLPLLLLRRGRDALLLLVSLLCSIRLLRVLPALLPSIIPLLLLLLLLPLPAMSFPRLRAHPLRLLSLCRVRPLDARGKFLGPLPAPNHILLLLPVLDCKVVRRTTKQLTRALLVVSFIPLRDIPIDHTKPSLDANHLGMLTAE